MAGKELRATAPGLEPPSRGRRLGSDPGTLPPSIVFPKFVLFVVTSFPRTGIKPCAVFVNTTLPNKKVVLLGAGHTNAHILRMWRMSPPQDARLTCVSNFPQATYSGMLPGTLAGLYPPDRMEIDLVRLCVSVGARLIVDEVVGLDARQQQLLFADRPPLPFDVLSIGIGSVPRRDPDQVLDETVLAIKPMQTFLDRLAARIDDLLQTIGDRPLRVAIVGAGVAGLEITFCLPQGLRSLAEDRPVELTLVDQNDGVGSGLDAPTLALVRRELASQNVDLQLGRRVMQVKNGQIEFDTGSSLTADLVLWVTSADSPELLQKFGLPVDQRGFLRTRSTLQSVAAPHVFVVGDSGTIDGEESPKAGVYAVRQGPILWNNIQRSLRNQPLQPYEPQHDFLKLLATGDRRAILSFRGIAARGGWCWRLKRFIDERFMDKYQDYRPMERSVASTDHDNVSVMRCAGCGGKVGGSVLRHVLSRLEIPPNDRVLVGLEKPDDAAVIATDGQPITVTTDFFAAPLDDPYLVGRIAALNAASDVFAMGARPHSALAMATIPVGKPPAQEQLLYELLAGSNRELSAMGATLVGGHTIEGPQITLGFTLLADTPRQPRTKNLLRPGDVLVLTKPLGTGVLLAAHMRAECRAEWFGPLLESMLLSNQSAAETADRFDVRGMTDVTGFGLAGHLIEMLRAAGAHAELRIDRIELLPGTADLIATGVESTLAPANRAVEADINVPETCRQLPSYPALFDPQTSGGLLLGIAETDAEAFCRSLAEQSNVGVAIVGHVVGAGHDRQRLAIV